MDTQRMLNFLSELKQNNNSEWMKLNKAEYLLAKNTFSTLIQELILRIQAIDNSIPNLNADDLLFKLNRDTRFSKDKTPYNPTFRAHISTKGKQPIPVGYYISISPNNHSFLGGGLFTPMFRDATTMIRDYITENSDGFGSIIKADSFTKIFTVEGETLKNVPRGYDREHPQATYIKNKSWYLEYTVPDTLIADTEAFLVEATHVFTVMQPFNHFLNTALKDFKMPERK